MQDEESLVRRAQQRDEDAFTQQAKLQDALEIVPKSVKPALHRAIAVSGTGYEAALEALD